MLTVQGTLFVVMGFVACFMGYSMFRSMLPLWGFVIGGWLAMTFVPGLVQVAADQQMLLQVGVFFAGGVIGAAVASPLYYLIIFVSGGALGALIGALLGALLELGGISSIHQLSNFTSLTFPPQPHTAIQYGLMVVLGFVFGGLAINFQKFMIIASSAFVGAAAMISGLSGVIHQNANTAGAGVLMAAGWLLLGFIGLFIQYRVMGDET